MEIPLLLGFQFEVFDDKYIQCWEARQKLILGGKLNNISTFKEMISITR